jgi:hypothetical protein
MTARPIQFNRLEVALHTNSEQYPDLNSSLDGQV